MGTATLVVGTAGVVVNWTVVGVGTATLVVAGTAGVVASAVGTAVVVGVVGSVAGSVVGVVGVGRDCICGARTFVFDGPGDSYCGFLKLLVVSSLFGPFGRGFADRSFGGTVVFDVLEGAVAVVLEERQKLPIGRTHLEAAVALGWHFSVGCT